MGILVISRSRSAFTFIFVFLRIQRYHPMGQGPARGSPGASQGPGRHQGGSQPGCHGRGQPGTRASPGRGQGGDQPGDQPGARASPGRHQGVTSQGPGRDQPGTSQGVTRTGPARDQDGASQGPGRPARMPIINPLIKRQGRARMGTNQDGDQGVVDRRISHQLALSQLFSTFAPHGLPGSGRLTTTYGTIQARANTGSWLWIVRTEAHNEKHPIDTRSS